MSKELEDFKKEMTIKLRSVIDTGCTVKYHRVEELINELKPKPEFVEGEHVIFFDKEEGYRNVRIFSSVNENNDCFRFKDSRGAGWKYCEKIDVLPMNMTVHDGLTEFPYGVNGNTLVYIKLTNGSYAGGTAKEFEWNGITHYQILKDLNS